ncbi:parathyroid hormone-related protein-like [Pseudochaenichthys georgianus]|uniref:parathyroid hormone-related protein-like n=1 Tax=Pseudochaenichthys georgianus TaxID=52239 RepID=UPI001469C85A|nr:parathyroid hormone-related protein-like [Pseudochaenichthys georgianus]
MLDVFPAAVDLRSRLALLSGHRTPIDAVSSRIKRSVSHAQLMHDKGRSLQDLKRRMWLQELLDEVHTAETRDIPPRPPPSGGGGTSTEGGGVSTTGETMHSKPPGGTKNLPLIFREEGEKEKGNLPQETNKSPRAPGKKKKKGRGGRRRGGEEKRKRRERSLGGGRRKRREEEEGGRAGRKRREEEDGGSGKGLEWKTLLGLQRK